MTILCNRIDFTRWTTLGATAALVIASLASCSSDRSPDAATNTAQITTASGRPQPGGTDSTTTGTTTRVVIDGQSRTFNDPVYCGPHMDDVFPISTGVPDGYGVGLSLAAGDTRVQLVQIHFPDQSLSMDYSAATGRPGTVIAPIAGMGDAAVTRSGNRYRATGHGVMNYQYSAHPPYVLKPFEVEMTCE